MKQCQPSSWAGWITAIRSCPDFFCQSWPYCSMLRMPLLVLGLSPRDHIRPPLRELHCSHHLPYQVQDIPAHVPCLHAPQYRCPSYMSQIYSSVSNNPINGSAYLIAPTMTYHAQTLRRSNEHSWLLARHTGTVCQNQSVPPLNRNCWRRTWKFTILFYLCFN